MKQGSGQGIRTTGSLIESFLKGKVEDRKGKSSTKDDTCVIYLKKKIDLH